MNHDCHECRDSGVVRSDYADDDGYEMAFCLHCLVGQELADQAFRDTLQHPEMQP